MHKGEQKMGISVAQVAGLFQQFFFSFSRLSYALCICGLNSGLTVQWKFCQSKSRFSTLKHSVLIITV